jgi:hypothetical protein
MYFLVTITGMGRRFWYGEGCFIFFFCPSRTACSAHEKSEKQRKRKRVELVGEEDSGKHARREEESVLRKARGGAGEESEALS